MIKVFSLFLSFMIFSTNTLAVEPVFDQQGMFYFNMTFDAGASTKIESDFGFRLDRTLMEPGETMSMNELTNSPAVLNLKLNDNGLKAFELNGIDYSTEYYVARAEGEPEAKSKRKINIHPGVAGGLLIGFIALLN